MANKKRYFEWAGVAASVVLVVFGVVAIVMGVNGHNTVNSSLKDEAIVGSPDMSKTAIASEVSSAKAAQAALFAKLHNAGVQLTASPIKTPSCNVAEKSVTSGSSARCFAEYMRIHTFGATSGLTYSQMGRYVAKPGTPFKFTDGLGATSDPKYAVTDPKTQQPVSNGRRDIWVTYTALTTALNTSYMASQLANFGIVVGIAFLLSGIGFGVLMIGGALRRQAKEAAEAAPAGKVAPAS
jgi:hypothetical protein